MSTGTGPINLGLPEQCHPYYARRYRRWLLNEAAYMGGDKWYNQGETYQLGPFQIQAATPGKTGPGSTLLLRESNRLWRHEREKDIRYQRRLRMSAYENVFRPQIDTVAATVAKACRSVVLPEGLEYIESNMDRWGQDAATARLRRVAWSHVYGHVYTLCEKPEYQEATAAPSRLHELAAGIRAYCCLLTPLDMLDWSWDAEAMTFRWALVRVKMPQDRPLPGSGESTEQHAWTKLYMPGEWVLYRDGKEFARGAGPDVVPITVQFAVGQDPSEAEPVGIPINDDVTDIVELRFNKSSWLADQESAQCFNQAHIRTTGGDLSDEDEQALGVHTYIGAEDFKWVAPSTDPMTHLMGSMDRDAAVMRQMQGLETKGETSQAAKSGVALQLEQQNMSALFTSYASAAEAGERAMLRMCASLEGLDPEEVVVQYVRDFSALDAVARFGTLTTALSVGQFTGRPKAELQKQIWLAANPECEQDVRDAVFAEIDAEAARAAAAREAQEVAAKAAIDRLANAPAGGKDAADAEDDDEEPEDEAPGKPNGRPMPMQVGKGE